MKYFLDTEFSERGPYLPVQLISIGIVAEDGREFYAVSEDFDEGACNDWVKANVLSHIYPKAVLDEGDDPSWYREPLDEIARKVREFIHDDKPEFWGYYADYDWVVFCQMFGTMMDLPKGWPMYCRDIKQLADDMQLKIPQQTEGEHNALNDARWNKFALEYLNIHVNQRAAAARVDEFPRNAEKTAHEP